MMHPVIKQTWIVSGVFLNLISLGMLFTYPYCLLPALREPDSPIKVDLESESWLASSLSITMMIGMFIASFLMDWIGRRNAHALMMLPGIAGWIIIYFATDVTTLMIGRIVGGLWLASGTVLGSTVVGEYTTPEYRGVFLGAKTAAVCCGNMFMHIISRYYDWRTVALISLVPLIITFVNICTWPESPSWLAMRGRYEKSEKEFYWLRGSDGRSVREFEELVQTQRERFNANRKLSFTDKLKLFFGKFKRKDFVLPVLIIFFSFILLEACGRHTFPAYAHDIMSRVMGSSAKDQSNSFLFTLGIDIVTVVSAIFSCILTKFLKRRTLLFFTGISSLVILSFICIILMFVTNGVINNERPWISLSSLVVYYSFANIGCTNIPVTLLGEILPLPHRATGLAFLGILITIPLLIFMKTTPIMLDVINISGTFAVYGLVMAVTLIYLYFAMPETRNRTLQEIEEYFNNGRFIDQHLTSDEEKDKMLKAEICTET